MFKKLLSKFVSSKSTESLVCLGCASKLTFGVKGYGNEDRGTRQGTGINK